MKFFTIAIETPHIMKNFKDKSEQYDNLDMEKFHQYLRREKGEIADILPSKDKHKILLDYYMNPNHEHNVYE